jgi:2-polyprenyl-6-hydroxyphenyl methylase/3-demethylubiquinone-9 3-methyltransferase
MIQTNSTVNELEVAKFNLLAEQWWDKEGPLKTLHDINSARLSFIGQFASINNHTILDVGCGGGILTEELAKQGAQATGLDVDARIIEVATWHSEKSNVAISYQCSPIEMFSHTPFDYITCLEMLEHVNHPELIIENCARLLKPQGLLFLSTINRTLSAYAKVIVGAEYVLRILPRQTHDFKKFIKPSELAAIARSSGFALVGMQGIDYNPFTRQARLTAAIDANYLMVLRKVS